MSERMDKANNEVIEGLLGKLKKQRECIKLIQFRANEALEIKRAMPDGHTWDREIACSNGLVDILDIIRETIGG